MWHCNLHTVIFLCVIVDLFLVYSWSRVVENLYGCSTKSKTFGWCITCIGAWYPSHSHWLFCHVYVNTVYTQIQCWHFILFFKVFTLLRLFYTLILFQREKHEKNFILFWKDLTIIFSGWWFQSILSVSNGSYQQCETDFIFVTDRKNHLWNKSMNLIDAVLKFHLN